ncbi:dipeptide/oligopeptide/nickel ABC transporter permease/ATP-binding protein [Brevibacterium jeotgali]|uniref:Peptide/nickel transport system permease protein n=1 Tax=Brevibacterium jeotgali TaxID=1262550 RepID=A0A2H1L3H3_9MICO|nr:dipeptide/oligopeptide/nickel ABC transporter permease/ATP-binding protein [Brevibacterium jeotgali]TWC01696.1 peptide/nickel transport system permease protein [Brevibacterium jeotgali]SMY11441.1 peptide/nickel transport system permease protein [Brevibacterium jeotgali]
MRTLRTLTSRPTAVVAIVVLAIVSVVAVAAPAITPHDPLAQDTSHVLAGPSAAHWLGTDYLGRDIMSRLVAGTQLSVLAAAEAVVIALLLGAGSAVVAVFSPQPVRWVLERVFDSFMALPFITFAVAIGALLGNSIHAAMVAVGVLAAPTFFRVVRASVLEISHTQYVEAARLLGVRLPRIIRTHVIPRIVPVLLVTSASVLAASLLVVASLTFLGVGVQPPTPTWGGMLSADLSYLALRPWNPVAPAAAIMITVAAVSILADRIRDLGDGTRAPEAAPDDGRAGEVTLSDDAAAAVPAQPAPADALVAIDDLCISTEAGTDLVRRASLRVPRGASVGILGESGSGKTMTVRALLGVLPDGVSVTGGRIAFDGAELAPDAVGRRDLHGRRIGTVFQDPSTWITPHLTVGAQVDEVLRHTHGLSKKSAAATRDDLFRHVGFRDVQRVAHQYPHELSGGMLQRILLAIAVTGEPDLLIADEATTALDVTVQAEVLDLIRRLRREHALTVLMISHDLAVLAHSCEYLYVFRDGDLVEEGPTEQVLHAPHHPYTQSLIADHAVFGIEALRHASRSTHTPAPPKETTRL